MVDGALTRHCELGREVPGEPLPSEVGDRPENDDGTGKTRMAEGHALVRRKLRHGLGPHQVLPMILEKWNGSVLGPVGNQLQGWEHELRRFSYLGLEIRWLNNAFSAQIRKERTHMC